MKKQINSEKLEQLTKSIEEQLSSVSHESIQKDVDELEREQYDVITSIIKNNISPKEEINHKVNSSQKIMRKVGQRFFNLFKITFTVEFAGVTLIHFTIPKVSDDGQIINKNNK